MDCGRLRAVVRLVFEPETVPEILSVVPSASPVTVMPDGTVNVPFAEIGPPVVVTFDVTERFPRPERSS